MNGRKRFSRDNRLRVELRINRHHKQGDKDRDEDADDEYGVEAEDSEKNKEDLNADRDCA